jgi:hypothetical protein
MPWYDPFGILPENEGNYYEQDANGDIWLITPDGGRSLAGRNFELFDVQEIDVPEARSPLDIALPVLEDTGRYVAGGIRKGAQLVGDTIDDLIPDFIKKAIIPIAIIGGLVIAFYIYKKAK